MNQGFFFLIQWSEVSQKLIISLFIQILYFNKVFPKCILILEECLKMPMFFFFLDIFDIILKSAF